MTDNHHTRQSERGNDAETPYELRVAIGLDRQGRAAPAAIIRRLHTQHQADQVRIKELETLKGELVNTAKGFLEAIETERNTTKTPAEINWMVVNHWAYMFAHLVKKDKAEGEHQQSRREQ